MKTILMLAVLISAAGVFGRWDYEDAKEQEAFNCEQWPKVFDYCKDKAIPENSFKDHSLGASSHPASPHGGVKPREVTEQPEPHALGACMG